MKKVFILTISALLAFGGVAKAETVSYKDKAGIAPDSIFYKIDRALEDISLKLASNEKKIDKLLSISEERLGEVEVIGEKDKSELLEKTLEDYNDTIEEVQNIVNELDEEKNENNANEEESEKTQDKINEVQGDIAKNTENSIKVLEAVKEKLKEKAKENIEAVIEMQKNKKEAVRLMVEKRHEFNDAKKDYNRAKVALKKAKASGDAEAIQKAEEELKSIEEIFNTKKQELKAAVENKAKVVKVKKNLNKDKKEDLNNNTIEDSEDKVENNVEDKDEVKKIDKNETKSGETYKKVQVEKGKSQEKKVNSNKAQDKKVGENKGKASEAPKSKVNNQGKNKQEKVKDMKEKSEKVNNNSANGNKSNKNNN